MTNDEQPIPTALVHDYLLTMRGAERSFAEIAKCWPQAEIYASVVDLERVGPSFPGRIINSSWLNHAGVRQSNFRKFLPLYPMAISSLDVGDVDLVVSSSSAFAHGVNVPPEASHVCYCYTPFRYAWHERERALSEVPRWARPALSTVLNQIKAWDLRAEKKVSHYIGISEYSADLIDRAYGRDASVVYPPVEVDRFATSESFEDYFLFVGETVKHKRIETALQAAQKAGKKLKIIGGGPERGRLEVEFGETAEFLGRIDDESLTQTIARAAAVVIPNVEEFGIVAVEAMASGRPVLATGLGGVSETVIDGVTGVLVPNGTVDEFAEAMVHVDFGSFSAESCRARSETYSSSAFRENLQNAVMSWV